MPVKFSRNVSPYVRSGFTGDLKSGFGVYDLTYLARGSKGAYFILEEKKDRVRRAMTLSDRMRNPLAVDWKTMDLYKPEIISRISYDSRMNKRFGRCGRAVTRRHSNTPYAAAANWWLAGARRWAVPAEMIYRKWKHVKHSSPDPM
ncbi:MAG: hypothetical protein ACYTFY_00010 [Planctomycetota bacterium]